jgi:tape measure domain-containing protein
MNNNEGTTWWAMGLDNSRFESDVAKSNALFRSIGSTADSEGSRIDTIFRKLTLTAAGFFTAQQALSYANKIATVRGEFQQLEVAFNTMLGSKQKADALMAQVVDTAAKTPFDLQGVASGAKQLLAYGVASEDVTKRLTQLGNIAAGLSIPLNDIVYLYGTTMVQGRLFTQDVRQFMGRGIPLVKELAKELGKTENEINAMVTAGKIGFPQVQKVLDNLTNSGGMFHNLMEEQSKTISGQISNLGDNISTMLNDIGKSNEGVINTVLESGAYLVENYQEIGSTIGELIVTYGAYKAAVMTVAATQKAVSTVKSSAEAEELAKLLTVEQQALISKQNLTKGTVEYAAAVKSEITAEMERQTAIATGLNAEVTAAREALTVRKEQQLAAAQLVETRKMELASTIESAKSEKVASMEKEIALNSEKQSRAALRAQKLLEQKDAAVSEARALKEAGASAEVVAAKNREIAAINAKLVAAQQEEIQCSQMIVAKRAEIKAIDSSVASKQIEAAQNRLNVALQEANTAEINKNSAARAVSSKRAALDTAVRKANTLETGMNTAAQAANLTTTNILSTAKLRLTAVAARLNAVIMANPWTIAAVAVAALAYGIYKLITYQTDAEKAQAKLNETISESEKAIGAERMQIDAMFARMKAAKKGTEEYKAAKDAILSKYGDYLKNLGDEKTALDDLAKAYKIVTQEAEKAARARAMETATKDASVDYIEKEKEVKDDIEALLNNKFKGEKDKDGIDLSETYYYKIKPVLEGKAEITQEIQDIVTKFNEEKDVMVGIGANEAPIYNRITVNDLQDKINEVFKARRIYDNVVKEAQKKFGENPNANKKEEKKDDEVFYTKGKSIAEIEDAITKGQEKLDAFKKALKDNNGLTEDGKKVTDVTIAAQEKYVNSLKKTVLERENDLKIIREVEERIDKLKKEQKETVKGSKEYNDLQTRIDSLSKRVPSTKSEKEKKDYSDDIKKNIQEEARIKKDMEFAVRQSKLNNDKDGFNKTMEQNQLNYEQEMEQLKRQQEDKLNKIQEWEKTIWQSKGKKGKFTPTTTELPEEDKKEFKKLEGNAGKKLTLDNQTAIDEMIKQYQTYADKRKAIEEKFQKDIAAMKAANEKAKSEGKSPVFSEENISQAGTDGKEAIEALDQEIASREVTFTVWADKITSMGIKQLKSALQSAKTALDKDGGKLSENEKAVLRTKIKTLEKQIKTSEAKDASLTSSEKSKKKWGDTLKTMNEVQETVDNICSSFDGLDDTTKTALTSAMNIAGGTIAMIMGIQALSKASAEGIKTVEKASIILAIIGAAVQILSALFSLSSKADKEHQEALKEIAENKLKMQREYNQLLLEQKLLMKEATSVFGEDKIAKAANAIDVYREAIAAYKEELKGEAPTLKINPFNIKGSLENYKKQKEAFDNGVGALNNVTVKTGSYTTGAWFWKKQHDVMTPVLDVYKDLVDEEGNLNKERAQAIIDTQTMSDENKALLQNLIDLQEQAEEAKEALRDYLESTFGSLGESIMDSLVNAIENDGVDAWEKFGEAGSSVLEDLGKQIAYELFFSNKFKALQKQLENTYGSIKPGESEIERSKRIAQEAKDLVASFYQGIGTDMQNAQNWMQQWKEEANKQGFNLWDSTREGSSKGIAAADQESVNELNGRATAIQGHTFIISEAMKELTAKISKVLEYLSGIQTNTEHCKHLETINGNIKEMKEGIDSMNTKGVNIRK